MAEEITNHPELVDAAEYYKLYRDFSKGKRRHVEGYIIPYLTEDQTTREGRIAFVNRKERTPVVNRVKRFLRIHRGHLAQKITVSGSDSDRMQEILADVDGYGNSLTRFSRSFLDDYMRDGRVGVLVDRTAEPASTGAEAAANNEKSYQVAYTATQIHDWEHFTTGPRKGQLMRVVVDEPSAVTAKGKRAQLRRYSVGANPNERVKCEILQAQDEKGLGSGTEKISYDVALTTELGLTAIPFVIMGCGYEDSFIEDIAEPSVYLLNIASVKSNINYNQGFKRNFAIGADETELTKAGESLITVIKNSDARIMTLEAGDPVAIADEEARVLNEINRLGLFERNQLADDTRQVQSAESKAKDMIARQQIYQDTMDLLAETLTKLMRFHAEFEGLGDGEIETIAVTIERDFGLDDEAATQAEEMQVFSMARELQAVEVQKAILRSRIKRLSLVPKKDQSPEEMAEELAESIDAAGPEAPAARESLGALFQ